MGDVQGLRQDEPCGKPISLQSLRHGFAVPPPLAGEALGRAARPPHAVILSERSESKDLPIAVVLRIHPALAIDDTIPQSADPSASLRVTGLFWAARRNRAAGG